MIWGMTLHPGVEYRREVTKEEHLTLASLDCRPKMTQGECHLMAHLVVKVNNCEHVLCYLEKGVAHQQSLDFIFQEGDNLVISVEGTSIMHITGYSVRHSMPQDIQHDGSMISTVKAELDETRDDMGPTVSFEDQQERCEESFTIAERRQDDILSQQQSVKEEKDDDEESDPNYCEILEDPAVCEDSEREAPSLQISAEDIEQLQRADRTEIDSSNQDLQKTLRMVLTNAKGGKFHSNYRKRQIEYKIAEDAKRNKTECISFLDSDKDEETTGSEIGQKTTKTSSLLNGQKESHKNKMRNQTGNYVSTSTPSGTPVALTISPQGVKPGTPSVAVTNQVLTQPKVVIPGSAASATEFPGVSWNEETKTVTFDIVLLGFGSKQFMSHPPRISMSPAEIKFHFTTVEHGCAPVTLYFKDIEKLHYGLHYGLRKSLPSVFIESTPSFALTARSRMNMKKPAENFDPYSKETFEKYLFFRPHDACFTLDLRDKMKNIIRIMSQKEPKTKVFKELKNTEINALLGQCTLPQARFHTQQSNVQRRIMMSPVDHQNRVGSSSTTVTPSTQRNSAVPQKIVVQSSAHVITQSSPIIIVPVQSIQPPVVRTKAYPPVRLITFPPPPAIGGVMVTSKDMECLQDGKILNDVIIEFYLKYLLEEKLSHQDRQRTHIFSSAFYKRLTQREYCDNVGSSCGEIELTPKEKRHHKVSKWTRKVDLFKKDFIIIPINESSHWYVAFICFPSHVQNTNTFPTPLKQGEEADSDASKEDGEHMHVSESRDDAVDDQSGVLEEEESKMDVDEQATSTGTDTSVKVTSNDESSLEEGKERVKTNGGQSSSSSAMQEDTTMQDASKDDDDISYSLHQRIKQEIPCILIMDSLKTSPKRHVMQNLREYLDVEWQTRKKTKCLFTTQNMKGAQLDVPQQSNFRDGGIFVLQYVEQFFKKPIRNFTTPIKGLGNWFPQREVKAKRLAITQLIWDLKEKQSKSKAAAT